jgi:DNA repair exonuclease SbcCD ATPase subunit
MAEVEKITETQGIKFENEEIERIQNFRNQFSEVTAKMGEVEIELIMIETQRTAVEKFKTELKEKYLELRNEEVKLAQELRDKYGDGEFDMNTGMFTPNQ